MKKQGLLAFWGRVKKLWFSWAEVNQHAAWFPFFIAVVVGIDAIIVVLPGDVLVVLAVLSNPLAWRRTATAAGIGGAVGAFLLYALVAETGGQFLSQYHPDAQAIQFFRHYGVASLAIGSVIPLFSWPPVVLAGLSSSPPHQVAFFLLIGRLARYFILCAGLRYGWTLFHDLRQRAHAEREETHKDS
jgi:membrane protein YqaA with SNARE-associated domain